MALLGVSELECFCCEWQDPASTNVYRHRERMTAGSEISRTGDDPLDQFDNTRDAETRLRQALRGRRLVCEVGVPDSARHQLLELLRGALRTECNGQLARVSQRYPALLATTVATASVFMYEAGDLWGRFPLPGTSTDIGQAFADAIERLRLERFPIFDEQGAHRYVSRILAHGGIPEYCLSDLFRLTVHAQRRGIVDASDVLDLIAEEKSWQQQIDRPVLRFLRDTGRVGRDFLQRVLDLTDQAESDQRDETVAERLGLPTHVVRGFRRFEPIRVAIAHAPRISRPRLLFDPDTSDTPEVLLPWGGQTKTAWRVLHEHGADVPPLDVSSDASDDVRIPVSPAARWRAIAHSPEGLVLRAFSIGGVSEDRPALVFDVMSGEQSSDPRFAAAREVWVLAPCQLTPIGSGVEVVQSLPMRDDAWAGWFVHEVLIGAGGDLAGTHRQHQVRVRLGFEIPLSVVFSNLVPGVETTDGGVVFDGPPHLETAPWAADCFDRWQILVSGTSIGEQPIPTDARTELINASLQKLFSDVDVSDVVIRIRGPMGASHRLSGAVVRGFRIGIPTKPMHPGETSVVAMAANSGIAVLHKGSETRAITVHASEPHVTIVAHGAGGTVELSFRCPVIRWRLRGSGAAPTPFDNAVIRYTLAPGQEPAGVLQLDTGRGDSTAKLRARGLDAQPTPLPRLRKHAPVLQFDLAPVLSSLLETSASRAAVDAEIDGRVFQVAELREAVQLSLRSIAYTEPDPVVAEMATLAYSVIQSKSLQARCLRLTCVDRPWRQPVTLSIGSGPGDGSVSCPRLRPGRYSAVIGLEADDGSFHGVGATNPARFDVPWHGAERDTPGEDDPRELLVDAVHGRLAPSERSSASIALCQAAALLLGSAECKTEAAAHINELLPIPLDEWVAAFDAAAGEYGMTMSGAVRGAVRVIAQAPSGSSAGLLSSTFASRLVRLAAVRRKPLIAVDEARAESQQLAGVADITTLRPETVLGLNAGAAATDRLRREVRELEQLPSAPLSANGRVLGLMRVRLSSREQQSWIAMLARAYRAGNDDLLLLRPMARAECSAARKALGQPDYADGQATLLLHVASFEAAAHLALGTRKAVAAAEFLASVARTFPEYVETRVAYCLCRYLP